MEKSLEHVDVFVSYLVLYLIFGLQGGVFLQTMLKGNDRLWMRRIARVNNSYCRQIRTMLLTSGPIVALIAIVGFCCAIYLVICRFDFLAGIPFALSMAINFVFIVRQCVFASQYSPE